MTQVLMHTQSNRVIDLLDPDPALITLSDIAVALGRLFRFAGHSPISVAQHSLGVCRCVEAMGETDPELLLCALLHDAHEAYMGDITSPVYRFLQVFHRGDDAIASLKLRLQEAIECALGVRTFPSWSYLIKDADRYRLVLEAMASGITIDSPAWRPEEITRAATITEEEIRLVQRDQAAYARFPTGASEDFEDRARDLRGLIERRDRPKGWGP